MRKILYKKGIILSVCFVVIIICVFGNNINILAGNVEENNQIITNDTIVTKDNIYQVLDFLQIEYDDCERIDSTEIFREYTVEELRNAINAVDKNPNQIILEDSMNYQVEEIYSDEIVTRKDKIINKPLSRTSQQDGYVLDFYVNVQYNKTKKKYVKTTGQGVDVEGELPLLEFKVGSSSLSSSCTAKTVNLKGKVKVNIYVGVFGMGLVKIKENEIKVNYNW